MSDRIAVPLPDGRWLLLAAEAFAAALTAGQEFAAAAQPPLARHDAPERWLVSRELAELTGIGDTTLESWAAAGRIPSIRAGKALRFKLSEVEAALRPRDCLTPAHAEVPDSNGQLNGRNRKTTTQERRR